MQVGLLRTNRLGHLALEPDLFFRKRWLKYGDKNAGRIFTIFIRGYASPANEQLLKMWERELFILHLPILYSVLFETRWLWSKSNFFLVTDMVANEYYEFNEAPPILKFTGDEELAGRRKLAEWGIDLGRDWFVCVFARDDNYLRELEPAVNYSYHDYRNADIDSFNLAIEEIVSRGGFVLRMGFHVNKPLSAKADRVIDYAVGLRSDFMDIFLPAKCRFFLGSASGISDVSVAFDRPRLGANCAPFGSGPIGKQSLFIPKLVASVETGEKFSFARLLRDFALNSDPKVGDGEVAYLQGYRYVDNTPEEILAVTREMLDRLDNIYEQTTDIAALRRIYFGLIPENHWCKGVKTPIGGDFLELHRRLLC